MTPQKWDLPKPRALILRGNIFCIFVCQCGMKATFAPMLFPLKYINTPPPGARGKFSFRLDQMLTFGKKTAPVVCGVFVLLFGRPQN